MAPQLDARKDVILVYRCNCGRNTTTIKRDFGPVRLSIACRAGGFANCPGTAVLHDIDPGRPEEPQWEWVAGNGTRTSATENMAVARAQLLSPLLLRKVQTPIPAESPGGGSSG